MVTILEDKCKGCGSCVDICHESCMSLIEGRVHIDYAFCSTCAQCIAICPQSALQWSNTLSEPFNDRSLPTSEEIDELLKQRRTIRHFNADKPDRRLVREIVNYGAYAPTHNHDFRIVAVDDRDHLEQIDRVVYYYNKKIYKYLYKSKIMSSLMSLLPSKQLTEYLKAKPKLEHSLKIERGYYCLPPVMLFIIGSKRVPLSLESAQYILYNINLYAMTKGLGCRNLVGNQMFFNRNKSLRDTLQIKNGERIFATLGIGYPSKKFRNKVIGRTFDLRWSTANIAAQTV